MKRLRQDLGLIMITAYALAVPAAATLHAPIEAIIALSIAAVGGFWFLYLDEAKRRREAERRAESAEEALRRRPRERPRWLKVLPGGKLPPRKKE